MVAQRILDKSDGPGGANGYGLVAHPLDRSIILAVDNASYRTDPGVYEFDDWTHVAAVIGENAFEIYINGEKQDASFVRGGPQFPPNIEANLRIGTWNHSDDREWNGFLDDIRIYNRTLNPQEIVQLLIEANSGLISHWKFDEDRWDGLSDEVVDSSGLGNHGVAINSAQTIEAGQIDRAGEFTGLEASIDLGSIEAGDPLQLTSGGTISAWFKQQEGGDGSAAYFG